MERYLNSEIEAWIDEHVHSKRNRIIFKLHFIDGLSGDEIAKHKEVVENNHGVEMSSRWVYTLISRAQKEIDTQ